MIKSLLTISNVIETELKTGNLGESYKTESKNLDGYDLTKILTNKNRNFTEKNIVITYNMI